MVIRDKMRSRTGLEGAEVRPEGPGPRPRLGALGSEKATKLAQKLGQLQPFVAVFLQECMANLHLFGQPNSFLAPALPPVRTQRECGDRSRGEGSV